MQKLNEAIEYIKNKIDISPEIGIVLGSGLGGLADRISEPQILEYSEIPGFSVSTAPDHKGRLVFGLLAGKSVVCMQGRLHYYEGHSAADIIFPIRVLREIGISALILTNAAGGINLSFNKGDIMLITDHINLTGTNPLIGKNDDYFGERFPDMTHAYTPDLLNTAVTAAEKCSVDLRKGVYIACSGPSYETPAEIRAFRTLGADAVGMSTVFEVIAASQMRLPVLAFSLITNPAAGVTDNELSGEDVIISGNESGPNMQRLVETVIGEM